MQTLLNESHIRLLLFRPSNIYNEHLVLTISQVGGALA